MSSKAWINFIVKLIPSRVLSLQARKPSGIIGRYLMKKIFNNLNADLNSFINEILDLQKEDRVLEVGFGSGKLIGKMADVTTEGIVEGIDFSQVMLKQARLEAGLTQEQVAEKLHTKKSAISRIENHAEDIRLSEGNRDRDRGTAK